MWLGRRAGAGIFGVYSICLKQNTTKQNNMVKGTNLPLCILCPRCAKRKVEDRYKTKLIGRVIVFRHFSTKTEGLVPLSQVTGKGSRLLRQTALIEQGHQEGEIQDKGNAAWLTGNSGQR